MGEALPPPDPRARFPDAPPEASARLPDVPPDPGTRLPPPLPTSIEMREPGEISQAPDSYTQRQLNIQAAHMGATSSPVNEARKSLQLARDLELGPQVIADRTQEVEAEQQRQVIYQKLAQLPRLSSYMAKAPQYAAAIRDEIDQWGTLDYVFGKYQFTHPEDRAKQVADIIQEGGPGVDQRLAKLHKNDRYDVPGWVLAFGRAAYGTATSIQTWATVTHGVGKTTDEIKAQRDIAEAPVPGDSSPVLRKVNSLIGMTPLIAAGMVHPAAAFGLLYAEGSGRVYEDLRLDGYDHQTAAHMANLVGFTTASIGAALGPIFQPGVLTKPMIGSLTSINHSFFLSMARSPGTWRTLMDLGKNFTASMAMNIAMASSEEGIKEAFDAARHNRPYDTSKVTSRAADAAGAWAEMALLSVHPAYKQARARSEVEPIRAETQAADERMRLMQTIKQNYEERGRAIRSMQEAADIVAAVDAIKESEFMKTNPEDARDLVRDLVSPRASQTVFVDPKAFRKMSPDAMARLFPDLSIGEAGLVPVNLVDFLTHPDAEAMLPHVAGDADLLTIRELTGIDLTQPPEAARGQNIPDEALDAFIAAQGARTPDQTRIPTVEEIRSAVQGARARRPAPDLGPDPARGESRAPPHAPESQVALKAWAEDSVKDWPASDLEPMARDHERRSQEAQREAMVAQQAATMHAEAGRPADTAKAQAQEAQRRANISSALHKAAVKAREEVQQIGETFARLASDDKKTGLNPREKAWRAGPDFGEAWDGIFEMLGASKERGYAARDLSDIYDKLAREQRLTGKNFDGWDLEVLNKLMQHQQDVGNLSLAELREVRNAVSQISQAADAENSVLVNGVRVAIGMAREDISEHLVNIPDVPRSQQLTGDSKGALSKIESAKEKVLSKTAGLKAVLNQPHTLFFKLGKVGDSLWFDGFIPGVSRENKMWGDISPQLEKIRQDVGQEILNSGNMIVEAPWKEKDGSRAMRLRSDVWHLALHMGGQGADAKLARGLGVEVTALHEWLHGNLGRTPDEAHVVMSKLIEPHWRLFDNLWEHYERHFKERGIAPPEKLKSQPMTIWGKEYSGGYGGRLKWLDFQEGKAILHPGSLEALLEHDVRSPATDNRHTVERDPDFAGKPDLNWNNVVESMRKEIHDIALRPFVEDAHKIFSDGELRGQLAKKMGSAALDQIYDPHGNKTSFLDVVARGSVADIHTAAAFTRGVMKLQGLAAYSAFSLNFRVMAGQVSHGMAAVPGLWINPMHAVTGLASAFSPERRAWAHSQSQILPLRAHDFEARSVELNRQMTGVEPGQRLDQQATDHLNWAAWREMDMNLSHWVWEMAYAKAVGQFQIGADGMTHEQAVREADKAVTMHMPAQDVYDQAAFVRDRSVAGLLYLVRNFPNTLANVAALNWWEARVTGKAGSLEGQISRAKAITQFVGLVMTAEVIGKAIIMRAGPRENQEPDSWLAENMVTALFYPYMIAEPAVALYHGIQGNRQEARHAMSRMSPAALSVLAAGLDDVALTVQHGDEEAGLRAAAHLIGLMTKSALPMKAYDISNMARNSEDPFDAFKKGMGYR